MSWIVCLVVLDVTAIVVLVAPSLFGWCELVDDQLLYLRVAQEADRRQFTIGFVNDLIQRLLEQVRELDVLHVVVEFCGTRCRVLINEYVTSELMVLNFGGRKVDVVVVLVLAGSSQRVVRSTTATCH